MYSESFDTEDYFPEPESEDSLVTKLIQFMRNVLETIVPAALIAICINLFLAQATRVYGQSMEPNLHTNQRLVVEKVSYNSYVREFLHSSPERGNVVVVSIPSQNGELLIKRVIGLPGDTIEIHDSKVFVNGLVLDEPYLKEATLGVFGPIVVPPGQIFVLGDNRSFSNDSRNFGTVPLSAVVGRAWFSYWPFDQIGFVN